MFRAREDRQLPQSSTHRRRFFSRCAALLLAAVASIAFSACGSDAPNDSDPDALAASEPAGVQSTPGSAPREQVRPKRIILVSLDTVGARNVGGYSEVRTPTLEKIASDGVRFDRFYAASTYTLPSHMSILTGLDAIEHGVVNMPSRLAPDVPTLASELTKAGYKTKAIVEGGFVKEHFGFDQGFGEFETLSKKRDLVTTAIWSVLDWMREQEDAPYFLFLHTYAAHAPYAGFHSFRDRHPELDLPTDAEIARLKSQYNREEHFPAPRELAFELRQMCTFYNLNSPAQGDWLGCGDQGFKPEFLESRHFEIYREGLLEAHREGIRIGDRFVGQLRDTLIELDQLEDTLLIVTSDHGEGMFEHSVHGHGYIPFDEVVKVPLFLSYPRRVSGGQVIEGLSWHLDLFPTILALAGTPFDRNLLGQDLTNVIVDGEAIDADRAIHPALLRPTNRTPLPMRRMTLKGDFKFITGHDLYGDPEGLLFDVKNSPDEEQNLRANRAEVFTELRELALDFDATLTPGEPVHQETREPISPFPGEVEPFELPDDVKKQLEELGYIMGESPDAGGAP
jgi:arylsulfatase